MSIRKIPIQNSSIAGNFFSFKNNKMMKFESQLEKKCFLTLEFDDDAISYIEQPLKIERYIPDILVKRKNEKDLLIEVKYFSEVEKKTEKLTKKLKIVQQYCDDNNMEFKVFTDKDLKYPYFSNISLIYNYSSINIEKEIEDNIIHLIAKGNIETLSDVAKNGIDICYVYKMIFDKKIEINLWKNMNYNTKIGLANDRS